MNAFCFGLSRRVFVWFLQSRWHTQECQLYYRHPCHRCRFMFLPVGAHCSHWITRTCNIWERGRASSVVHIKLHAPAALSHIVREMQLQSEGRGYWLLTEWICAIITWLVHMVHVDSCSGSASFHLHKHIYIYIYIAVKLIQWLEICLFFVSSCFPS